MRLLVTGHLGYIGTRLTPLLLAEGSSVSASLRPTARC